jgi:hypothetical protein
MRMYVANCTQQRQIFMYRVPEEGSGMMGGMRVQDIEIGQQVPLSGDLNKFQVDSIVQQHARYGMVAVEEIDRTRGAFTGLCYSVDKPVPVSKLLYVINANKSVLDLRGQEIRKEAAVAVNQQVETQMEGNVSGAKPPQLEKLEIEVQEEKSGNGPAHKPMDEKLRVTRSEDPTPMRPLKARRRE